MVICDCFFIAELITFCFLFLSRSSVDCQMGVASRSSKLPTEQRSSPASLRYMGKNEIKQMRIFVFFFF